MNFNFDLAGIFWGIFLIVLFLAILTGVIQKKK